MSEYNFLENLYAIKLSSQLKICSFDVDILAESQKKHSIHFGEKNVCKREEKKHMKLRSLEYEVNLESPAQTAAYFRMMYEEKKEDENKLDYIEEIFYSGDKGKQHLIIELISDLLTDAKKDAYLSVYLQSFLDEANMTYTALANRISAYTNNSAFFEDTIQILNITNDSKEKEDIYDIANIKSSLQSFLKNTKAQLDNNILRLVSGYFSVSPSLLITGKGERYYIDLEKLKEIADNENKEVDDFLDSLYDMDFLEYENVNEKEKEYYRDYINHNATVFAEIVSQTYGVDVDEILITEECWIELENFPIRDYFNRLKPENKKIVEHVLFNLNIREID